MEYPSLNIFITSDDEACVRPDPMLQGYIVLEIWDEQVNIGFGGSGHEFKDRAIRAIEQELEHRD